jgi:hypothetical protein
MISQNLVLSYWNYLNIEVVWNCLIFRHKSIYIDQSYCIIIYRRMFELQIYINQHPIYIYILCHHLLFEVSCDYLCLLIYAYCVFELFESHLLANMH